MQNKLMICLLILLSGTAFTQLDTESTFNLADLKKLVIIQPTGEMVNDLPEMTVLADSSALHQQVIENISNSFINEFLDLYLIAQIYLKNNQILDSIEPAYLALTTNQGGFAKFGFTIKAKNHYIEKQKSPYVDITINQAIGPPNKLMSFTQLYPHEMGHVFLHLLSPEDTLSNNTKNVDMHFFSIVTDYSTAFNEGFAEHIENVSRFYEKNEAIKEGIFSDIKAIEKTSKHAINGFERDFVFPFRLGYYKASMLNWYQRYEDYMRYKHAHNGDIQYKNSTLSVPDIEDQLSFRNSGVRLNRKEKRNLVQLNATEGAVSAFFTHLSTSKLSNHYLDSDFYLPFLPDSTLVNQSPETYFTPLQNQFIKYFFVFHQYVVFNNSSKSQFIDFIDGYIQSFPAEKDAVKNLFKAVLGTEYSNKLPPPLWLLVKNHRHRLLTFDPFDAITVPIYTFDLNAAETEDLQTIEGITLEDAIKIVNFRNTNGFFTNFAQLKLVPELPEKSSSKIISASLDEDYLEQALKDFEPKLTISSLVSNPLKYIFIRACIYFLLLFYIMYFIFFKGNPITIKQLFLLFSKNAFLWVVFVTVGLLFVFLTGGYAYVYVILFSLLLTLLSFLIYRKHKSKMYRTFAFIGAMSLFILISVA